MANNNLIDEDKVPSNWVAAEQATPAAPPAAHDIPQTSSGSISPDLQNNATFVSTAIGSPRVPTFSLMPFGPAAKATVNAASKSVSINNPTPAPPAPAVSSQVTLDVPAELTPTAQTVTLPGPLVLAWAPEPGLTVFSGPASAAPGFDGAFYATKISAGAGSFTTAGGTPSLPSGEYAIYIASGGSISGGTVFTGAPAGWTVLAQSTGVSPQYAIAVGSSPVSATDSWTASGGEQLSGMIVYLKGALPAFGNSIAATPGTTSASATLTGMTPGNSILVLCQCVLRFPATTGIMSDSQGNTPILLGSVGLPFAAGLFGSQLFMYLIPGVIAASDTVTFSVSPASTSNSLRMALYEIATPTAISAVPRFQLPAPPNVSVVTGILSPHNGGTGADLATTGGASEVLMQTTVGGAITVAQLAASDLSNGTTGSSSVVLSSAPTITNPVISGKVTSYNGKATVSGGMPSEVKTVDLINQAAAITATNLTTAAPSGMARISWVATVTQAATISSVLGGTNGFQIIYNDQDTSVTKTIPGTIVAGVDTNSTNSTSIGTISGCIIINTTINSTIQYQMDYTSSGATPMQYNLHIKLENM